MSMSIYLAHYRTVFLMLSVHRVLLEQMCLKFAIEAGDAEIWIARIIAKCIPDGRTNHGERTTQAVTFLAWRASKQWLAEPLRCCRSASWATGVHSSDR